MRNSDNLQFESGSHIFPFFCGFFDIFQKKFCFDLLEKQSKNSKKSCFFKSFFRLFAQKFFPFFSNLKKICLCVFLFDFLTFIFLLFRSFFSSSFYDFFLSNKPGSNVILCTYPVT